MSNATVTLMGLGPVAITTDLDEIVLVGALTAGGDPVNCKTIKVARNEKAAAQAAKVETAWLKEVKPGHFMLIED